MTARLIVEPPMAEREAAAWTTPEERAEAAAFAPARRREYLAWRAVVRRELGRGVRIGYDPAGAPQLLDGQAHISVSHCPGRVAVLMAGRRCAVDIESAARNFERAAPRYLTPDERALSTDPVWFAAAWCAKETLYKYAGQPGLDLLRDLRLERVDWRPEDREAGAGGRIVGRAGEPAEGRVGELSEVCLEARSGECAEGCVEGRIVGRIAGDGPLELAATIAGGFVVVTIA